MAVVINYLALALLIVVCVYDIYLSIKKKETLSQQYQKLFTTYVDIVVLAGVLVALCYLAVLNPALRIFIAGIASHVVWPNKETHI